MAVIVVATHRPWHIERFNTWDPPDGFEKVLISSREDLASGTLRACDPRYVFLPHWSWMIPREIYQAYDCVMFHPGDLPYGRGGSPLQNLIVRGIYHTRLAAFKVVGEVDAGPIYLKRPLDLSWGSAGEIFRKIAEMTFEMIDEIVRTNPAPQPQVGESVVWQRRTPQESRIPPRLELRQLYDFIRMLDAEGYPNAFVEGSGYRIELRNARLEAGRVLAECTVMS